MFGWSESWREIRAHHRMIQELNDKTPYNGMGGTEQKHKDYKAPKG